MKQYLSLREQYPRFAYRGYEIEENESCLRLTYRFETVGLSEFAPVWVFPKAEGDCHRWSKDRLMQDMIFSLGMVELVSYWKIACPPTVAVEAGWLNQDQIDWWKDLYFNGLGEFFYVNGIEEADPNHFMNIRCAGRCKERHAAWGAEIDGNGKAAGISAVNSDSLASGGVLVPIGGGKDSAVTLELLRLAGKSIYAYIINPRGATIHTTEVAGLDAAHVISAKRTLDPNMLELNRQGYLNGHTPFSALVAFSSLIAARLLNLSYVALSNESSANESTVAGSTVNHQYSKSFEFEQDFHDYVLRYLPGNAYYFSLLRPLSEFQIAKYFAGLKQYHPIFRSCNAGSKTDSWCGHCPKCLFVYLILSPFLSREAVRDIFGRDMLEDETLKGTLDQLTGVVEEKPFECVGSRDEVNTAIVLTIGRLEQEHRPLPALLAYYKGLNLYETYQKAGDRYSAYCDTRNLLPDFLMDLVRKYCVETA